MMNVLLVQLDGKLPNVALMRLAAHHRGGAATELCVGFVTRAIEAAAAHGAEYEGVPTMTLKKHATGRGNADKEAVRTAMLVHWNDELTRLRRTIQNHDEADALALLAFGD